MCLLPTTSLFSILSMSLLHFTKQQMRWFVKLLWVCMFGSPYFQTFKFPDSLWSLESLLKENYRHACFISCSPPHVSIVQNLWYIVWYFRFLYNLTLLKKFDISQQSLLFCSRSLTHHSIQTFFNLRDNPKMFSFVE